MERLVTPDNRGRVMLAGLANHPRYAVTADDEGVITLTPVVLMPAAQAARMLAKEAAA